MVRYAHGTEGFFKQGEDERIVQFLSVTQTKEAAETRVVGAVPTPDDRPLASAPAAAKRFSAASSLPTIGVTVLSAAAFGTLLWRRPKSPSQKVSAGRTPAAVVPTTKQPVL